MFTRGGGRWSKKSTICKLLYHRKCKQRGIGGQKKPNLVNVVCERPLRAGFEWGDYAICKHEVAVFESKE